MTCASSAKRILQQRSDFYDEMKDAYIKVLDNIDMYLGMLSVKPQNETNTRFPTLVLLGTNSSLQYCSRTRHLPSNASPFLVILVSLIIGPPGPCLAVEGHFFCSWFL